MYIQLLICDRTDARAFLILHPFRGVKHRRLIFIDRFSAVKVFRYIHRIGVFF